MKESKINLVGKLIANKLGFKYLGYEKNYYNIDLRFINKEGFKRCYATDSSRIKEYCNYTDNNIMKVLFNM